MLRNMSDLLDFIRSSLTLPILSKMSTYPLYIVMAAIFFIDLLDYLVIGGIKLVSFVTTTGNPQ